MVDLVGLELHVSICPSETTQPWYTRLKYAKSIFLRDLQEQKANLRPNNPRIILAVLLLATSGMALPLFSFGVTTVSVASAPTSASVIAVFVIQTVNQSHGKVVLDGVSSVFVVAPPAIGGSHQVDEFGSSRSQNHTGGPSEAPFLVGPDDTVIHDYHVLKLGFVMGLSAGQGFGPSASWSSNGGVMRAGFAGETMLVPTPASAVSSVTAAVPKVWWDFFQRRSKFEIYVEMLELMKRGPMTPFEVAFYARLNHKRTKEYAEFLAEAGYLQAVNEDGRALYALTKEGIGFLERVQALLVRPRMIEVTNPSLGYQRDF